MDRSGSFALYHPKSHKVLATLNIVECNGMNEPRPVYEPYVECDISKVKIGMYYDDVCNDFTNLPLKLIRKFLRRSVIK